MTIDDDEEEERVEEEEEERVDEAELRRRIYGEEKDGKPPEDTEYDGDLLEDSSGGYLTRFCGGCVQIISTVFLLMDLVTSILGIITFTGLPECCGQEIGGDSHLTLDTFLYCSYAYLVLVVLQFYPVVLLEIPLAVLNPILGYIITLGSILGASPTEAMVMACLEAVAFFLDAGVILATKDTRRCLWICLLIFVFCTMVPGLSIVIAARLGDGICISPEDGNLVASFGLLPNAPECTLTGPDCNDLDTPCDYCLYSDEGQLVRAECFIKY